MHWQRAASYVTSSPHYNVLCQRRFKSYQTSSCLPGRLVISGRNVAAAAAAVVMWVCVKRVSVTQVRHSGR